jgi:ankyrin repeat protein
MPKTRSQTKKELTPGFHAQIHATKQARKAAQVAKPSESKSEQDSAPKYTPEEQEIINNEMLNLAEWGEWDDVVQKLKEGADITYISSESGHTLLHFAARDGEINLMKQALEAGVDKNLPCFHAFDSYNPMHYATENAQNDAIRLLAKQGASLTQKTDGTYSKKSPVELASGKDKMETLALLRSLLVKQVEETLKPKDKQQSKRKDYEQPPESNKTKKQRKR